MKNKTKGIMGAAAAFVIVGGLLGNDAFEKNGVTSELENSSSLSSACIDGGIYDVSTDSSGVSVVSRAEGQCYMAHDVETGISNRNNPGHVETESALIIETCSQSGYISASAHMSRLLRQGGVGRDGEACDAGFNKANAESKGRYPIRNL